MQESDTMSKEEHTKKDPEHCISESSCYTGEPKGKKWMESKHWQESQPKPKHRQIEVPEIQGVHNIIDDEKVVTDVKMKFKKERV